MAQPPRLDQLVKFFERQEERQNLKEIKRLGLEGHVKELEENGLVVVPPELTGLTPERCDQMVGLLLQRAEESTGCTWTVEGGPSEELSFPKGFIDPLFLGSMGIPKNGKWPKPSQIQQQQIAQQDRVFRDLVTHPMAMALIQHTLGSQARLSSSNSFIKWRGEGYGTNLGMHADQAGIPLPWGSCMNANANWCLTDYTREGGAFAYVPGSHHRKEHPVFPEAVERAVPVEAPRGSLIVFHGQLWHGAYPKLTDGLRVTLSMYYRHKSASPQENLPNSFPEELLDDCERPKLLRKILGVGAFPYNGQIMPMPRAVGKKGNTAPPAARL